MGGGGSAAGAKGESRAGALRFSEEHLLQVNQTRLLIFSIVWVEVRGDVQVDGFFALDELKVVAGSGCDAYYRAVAIGREVVQRERA